MEHIMEMEEFLNSDRILEAHRTVHQWYQEDGENLISTFANLNVKYRQHKITKIPKSIRVYPKKGATDYETYYLEPKNDGRTYYYKNHFGSGKLIITDEDPEEKKLGISKDGSVNKDGSK